MALYILIFYYNGNIEKQKNQSQSEYNYLKIQNNLY